MNRFLFIALFSAACLPGPGLRAQSETGKTAPPPVTASLVPVGANSDSYWVGDGPGMRAVPLDPGAAPPATLSIRHRKGFVVIPAILNRPSMALPVSAGTLRVFATPDVAPDEETPPVFGDFKIPTTPGHYDVFLNRSQSRKDWSKPEHLVLGSSPAAFPPDTFRIINLCALPIRAVLGATTIDLPPRQARMTPVPAGTSGKLVPVQAAHPTSEGPRIFLRTGIKLMPRQRANLIFYPGRDSKKPCQATWFYQSDPGPMAGTPESTKP